jgi:hypothetical protein
MFTRRPPTWMTLTTCLPSRLATTLGWAITMAWISASLRPGATLTLSRSLPFTWTGSSMTWAAVLPVLLHGHRVGDESRPRRGPPSPRRDAGRGPLDALIRCSGDTTHHVSPSPFCYRVARAPLDADTGTAQGGRGDCPGWSNRPSSRSGRPPGQAAASRWVLSSAPTAGATFPSRNALFRHVWATRGDSAFRTRDRLRD